MPTQIDFYLLQTSDSVFGEKWLCQLLEKVYLQKRKAYLYVDNPADAQHFDQLLWTFRQESFIPHGITETTAAKNASIQIGCQPPPTDCNDILVNYTATLPDFYTQFQRVLEVVVDQPERVKLARTRYQTYKKANCALQTHKISVENSAPAFSSRES